MKKYNSIPVTFDHIEIKGGFWKEKQDLFCNTTIKAVYDRFDETGRFEALKCNWKEGMPNKPHIFWESDVTKWIEGAAYFLQKNPDPDLEEKIDELVKRMVDSQDEDGYLNAYFTVVEPESRFTKRTDHELYCAGHLVEGGIAYANATGKKDMLNVAIRYIDLIDRVFRIEESAKFDTPGHEEIELALIKLYNYTGEKRYLKLAEYFINTRGKSDRDETYDFADQEHMQSHLPVREQVTAEGHSVRALYLYSGMADLAFIKEDDELYNTCKKLFTNIVNKRMYITGGIGSTHRGESFTFDYDLPEYTAYAETCASIALALFCKRMWLIEPNSIYADYVERAIYNTVLSGISLSGDCFFYENPLSTDPRRNTFNNSRPKGLKEHLPILKRVKVFDCSCCPPNLLRIIGAIGDYMYSTLDNIIYTHCYMDALANISLQNKTIKLEQKTNYPYDGNIRIITHTDGEYTLALRIPTWASKAKICINKNNQTFAKLDDGYVYLNRTWKDGDEVILELEFEVKIVEANPKAIDLCGRGAITRGPIVYCAEGINNPYELRDVRISRNAKFQIEKEMIENFMIPVIKTKASVRENSEELYHEKAIMTHTVSLKLIPYFSWANRDISEMTTWFLLS